MRIIERYFFKQMLGPTLFALAALTGVALLSQSLQALDVIVEQRQTAGVFAQVTLLALPQLISMILPVAMFVAALVALNRLHGDHEIVVAFSAGMSRWRVIQPAMRLATYAALAALVVNLWVQPYCFRLMREVLFKVDADLAASLVREGEFVEPAPGLTVYAQRVDERGVLQNLFVYQEKQGGGSTTFNAREGQVGKRASGPVLIMRDGANQELKADGVLAYLQFQEYILDLSGFGDRQQLLHYKISDRFMHELMFPDALQIWEQHNRKKMLAEAHGRLSSPLYIPAFMLMALAAVLGGPFSRLGYARRIAAIGGAAIGVRVAGFAIQAACDGAPWLNILQYVPPIAAGWWGWSVLFRQKIERAIGMQELGGLALPGQAAAQPAGLGARP